MDYKQLTRLEVKDEARGEVRAVFSTFGVIDKDGDVTQPDAFDEGATVPISAYGHASWDGQLPVGLGSIRSTAKQAVLEGQFFMDTTHGRDTFATVKALADKGLGEWSYGYDPVEYSFGEQDGQKVRFLSKLKVHEVSPVLIGAGVNTRTLSAKSDANTVTVNLPNGSDPAAVRRAIDSYALRNGERTATVSTKAIRSHSTEITARAWDAAAIVDAIPPDAGVDALRSVYAWCDGDPTAKASYRFPHHHGIDGPANVRALVAGIAVLNGAKGQSVPDADRHDVYEHLATHLRDADRDVPDLRAAGGEVKVVDEAAVTLVGVDDLLQMMRRVVAVRASHPKGKGLSLVNREILDWIGDDLREIAALCDTPDDDMAHQYARYVAMQRRLSA
jgi:hypothetical protein